MKGWYECINADTEKKKERIKYELRWRERKSEAWRLLDVKVEPRRKKEEEEVEARRIGENNGSDWK